MLFPLKQSVADQKVLIGPFCEFNENDELVPVTSLTIVAADVKLHKSGATSEVNASAGASHVDEGRYLLNLSAADVDTLGPMKISVYIEGYLPVELQCDVLPVSVYNARYGNGDTPGVTTLLSRVTDLIRTKSQDDTADTGINNLLSSINTATGNIDTKTNTLIGRTNFDPTTMGVTVNVNNDKSGYSLTTPQVTAVASAVRTNLATELARMDVNVGSRLATAAYTAPDNAGIATAASGVTTLLSRVTSGVATLWANLTAMISGSDATAAFTSKALENAPAGTGGGGGDSVWSTSQRDTVLANALAAKNAAEAVSSRLTSARAGYIDKLNVSGTLAHTGNAATFKADVSGLLTASAFASAYVAPDNVAIGQILAKTNNLPNQPASTSDVQINFNPVIEAPIVTVNPTVLSQASINAFTEPILNAIAAIEIGEGGSGGSGPTVEQIAARLFVNPANKLFVGADGSVVAVDIESGTAQNQVFVKVVNEDDEGVENLPISILDTTRRTATDIYGNAVINLNNGLYSLRLDAESIGYNHVADILLTINGEDVVIEIELTRKHPIGKVMLPLTITDQSSVPLKGVRANALLTGDVSVIEDVIAVNATSSKPTNSLGQTVLYLFPEQDYTVELTLPDLTKVSFSLTTPEAGVTPDPVTFKV